jgi:hypothetical protein
VRKFALAIAIATLFGCATGGRQALEVNGRNLQEQLEDYIDDYSNQVLNQCIEIHGKALASESKVDCSYQGDLSAMHLSFLSVAHHNAVRLDVQRLEYHWCASAQSKTGKTAHWVRHFRQENAIQSRPCYKGDRLVALGKHVEAQAADR